MSDVKNSADVVVVGAGFSGLYLLYRLEKLGLSAIAIEAADSVGGTWYWNRYPGARCDIESMSYSYSFSEELQQEWQWTERFPSQPEILEYLNHVADRFDLRRHIRFNTRVTAAHFDEASNRWTVDTDSGDRIDAQFCVMATGCLSTPRLPDLPGIADYAGSIYHTAQWPHDGVDFTGRRVAVVGTGSSGIQAIPLIAGQAAELTVFQRTPNFVVPARNVPIAPDEQARVKADYPGMRQRARESYFGVDVELGELNAKSALEVSADVRTAAYEEMWARGGLNLTATFADLLLNPQANDTAADFVRGKIREAVHDKETAERLIPTGYPIFAKRLCIDTGYYETFNRPNVKLVSLRETPLTGVTPAGLRTSEREYEVDDIVFATGFDAMTGTLLNIDIRGRDGVTLSDKWADGPRTYLGVATAGFPNLFLVTGPGSPSVLSNMVTSIEQHAEWITDCIAAARERGTQSVEASQDAEDFWVAHVGEVANFTVYPQAPSWYTGANIDGKPRVFMPYIGGVGTYRNTCADIAAKNYQGFVLA
jgi:cyclohexanone monooxygenase